MANRHKLNQSGSMSLLTVIFLALLLTIVTISFIRLAIIEQRQATDDDLTTRAFYAAESGVEDGKRALALWQSGGAVNLNEDVCQPADVVPSGLLSADLSTEYTCQLINLAPGNFLARLDAWEGATIPLNSGGSAFNRVQIEWHLPEAGQPYGVRGNSDTDLPTVPDWISAEYPAMLRTAVFWHDAGATFASSSVDQYALFINPAASNAALNSTNDRQVVNGFCQPAVAGGGYACTATVTVVSSSTTDFYLRLQALYTATDVRVTLFNGNNPNPVLLEDVQAAIDVTGRAGDVYRRIEARVPLTQFDYPFPDIALWSNTDICKAFSVTDDTADYAKTPCPWQL